LIARIHSPVPSVARMIHDLLTNVGKEHPQALVYPLSVASKSQASARVSAANRFAPPPLAPQPCLTITRACRVRVCRVSCVVCVCRVVCAVCVVSCRVS